MYYDVCTSNCVQGAAQCMIKLIVICVIGKYLSGSIPFFAVILYFVQAFYLRTSRQIRLIDIEAKAPLFGNFLETIEGI
jgi:ATP-binding cassette subfamily C (CFTR/MRP) protein 1